MKCPGCQYENADGARFCGECGNRLSDAAPPAGRDSRAYIPKHLATKILEAQRLFTEMDATARALISNSRLQPTGTSPAAVEARTR